MVNVEKPKRFLRRLFQAEDGIRDTSVTGVQTCALPIFPAVYVTLERLEEKGYLTSSFTDPTPERGGRSKRMFQLTSAGERALKESAATAQRIYESLRAAKWRRV